jgi:hypothetical protein
MILNVVDSTGGISAAPTFRVFDSNGRLKSMGTPVGSVAWGSITGTITAQTDLILYLSTNYVPVTRNLTINGTTYDLSADRTWTIADSLPYGVASGTNNYTVTISGVTSYVAGDAYIINFTNGNDADSDIDINGLGVKTLVKEFDVQLTGGDIVSGQQLIIMYDGTNFQTLGVAPNQLFAYVTNDDSVTITKGQPVYAFGSAGNRMSVKLAYNTTDATSAQTVGVVFSTSIAPNQRGFVICQGVISGVNTGAYSAGDQLYLGATAGTLTNVKPYAPNHLVYVGIVERANAGNGQIYIKPQNGYEMNELHDVQSNGAVNKDILYRDTTVTPNLWKPASISTILGYTPQAQLNGTGFVVATGTVISYDNTAYAPLASPTFTGDPKAPTPAAGDNDTSIATTAFVNTAIQSTSPTVVLFRDYAPASLTGTLTNTLVWSTSVNANVFQTNDLLEIRSYFNSNAANGTTTNWRLYVNTSASLTGATQIGAYANGSGTGNGGYQRNIFVTASGASGNFRTLPIAANVTNSYGVSSSAIANFTVNTTVTLYFIWAIQLGNAGNTASIQGTIATITR